MAFRRTLGLFVLVLGIGFGLGQPARAAASDAAGFIDAMVQEALKALNDKQMSQAAREQKFHAILDKDFDMGWISHFVLGRYWNATPEADRQQFVKIFTEYVVRSYAQRFSEYSGEQVKVTGSRAEGETATLVQSQILRTGDAPPAKVDWRVRKGDQGFKIVDVDVEGVSMIVTQREQFSTVIQRQGGVVGLNKMLQDKLASGDTSLAAPILPKKQ